MLGRDEWAVVVTPLSGAGGVVWVEPLVPLSSLSAGATYKEVKVVQWSESGGCRWLEVLPGAGDGDAGRIFKGTPWRVQLVGS